MFLICIWKQYPEKGSIGFPRWPKGPLIQEKMRLQRWLTLLSCVAFGQRSRHLLLRLPDLALGVGTMGSLTLFPVSWQKCPFAPLVAWRRPSCRCPAGLFFLLCQPPGEGETQTMRKQELRLEEGDNSLSLGWRRPTTGSLLPSHWSVLPPIISMSGKGRKGETHGFPLALL